MNSYIVIDGDWVIGVVGYDSEDYVPPPGPYNYIKLEPSSPDLSPTTTHHYNWTTQTWEPL